MGGDDRVVNLESSVNTHYDALLVSAEKRGTRFGFRAGYTLAKAFNYANDDQIPFSNGPIDPNDLRREYRPDTERSAAPVHACRLGQAPGGILVAPIWTLATGVPMDILMPDGQSRVPIFQRNAGGRVFTSAADLDRALADINASGGINGVPLPLVGDSAQFSDSFNSLDARISRPFNLGHIRLEPMLEIFNVFNVTNILGVSVRNYLGFSNVLVRDSNDPEAPDSFAPPRSASLSRRPGACSDRAVHARSSSGCARRSDVTESLRRPGVQDDSAPGRDFSQPHQEVST